MRRLPFNPARNIRHRHAALALYRALVRSGNKIPLPRDVLTQSPRPIADLLRKRFRGNGAYTSLRLVYASMAAGYNALTLLAKARVVGSAENVQITNHLRAGIERSAADRAARPPSRPRPVPSHHEPLLVNTAPAGAPPKYASSYLPRPASALGGRPRKVPNLCTTSFGQPFVRIRKPQPRMLSKAVGLKNLQWQYKVGKIGQIDEELTPDALLEDEWDRIIAEQMKREKGSVEEASRVDLGPTATFCWGVQLSRLWWECKTEEMWQDWVARGEALHDLVEQERLLAQEESGVAGPPGAPADAGENVRPTPSGSRHAPRPNVEEQARSALPLANVLLRSQKQNNGEHAVEKSDDPFILPSWAALVADQRGRMMSWVRKSTFTGPRPST
ncbi:hypothetical protein RJ55_03782 [Drechmeria coniospora]|nr:hypothetical protein RJ55_03782 [Drechmeria coniospora]